LIEVGGQSVGSKSVGQSANNKSASSKSAINRRVSQWVSNPRRLLPVICQLTTLVGQDHLTPPGVTTSVGQDPANFNPALKPFLGVGEQLAVVNQLVDNQWVAS